MEVSQKRGNPRNSKDGIAILGITKGVHLVHLGLICLTLFCSVAALHQRPQRANTASILHLSHGIHGIRGGGRGGGGGGRLRRGASSHLGQNCRGVRCVDGLKFLSRMRSSNSSSISRWSAASSHSLDSRSCVGASSCWGSCALLLVVESCLICGWSWRVGAIVLEWSWGGVGMLVGSPWERVWSAARSITLAQVGSPHRHADLMLGAVRTDAITPPTKKNLLNEYPDFQKLPYFRKHVGTLEICP